jgi:hypothetical protein
MRIENNKIIFDYLTTASSSTIGCDEQVSAQLKSAVPFNAANAPGQSENLELAEFVRLGEQSKVAFNAFFE